MKEPAELQRPWFPCLVDIYTATPPPNPKTNHGHRECQVSLQKQNHNSYYSHHLISRKQEGTTKSFFYLCIEIDQTKAREGIVTFPSESENRQPWRFSSNNLMPACKSEIGAMHIYPSPHPHVRYSLLLLLLLLFLLFSTL